jgi:hypothetical protein
MVCYFGKKSQKFSQAKIKKNKVGKLFKNGQK